MLDWTLFMYPVKVDQGGLKKFYSKPQSSWTCDNLANNILDQYEILAEFKYLLQARENNLKVHKMTANKK